jgi:hypothetical protein
MDDMFHGSVFNGDISNWDVGMCRSFGGMFYRSAFCGDLERWNLVNPELMTFDMLECSLLDWNNCLPQWYKVIYRNQNVVEDFNELDSIDDDEDKNLPF